MSQSSITSKAKPKMPDTMRSLFQGKHIHDSMFFEDLSRWHQG